MRTGNTAHTGHDGHQDREQDDLVDGGLEQVDHGGGQEGRAEVDAEPERAPPGALEDGRKHVVFLVEARGAHQRVLGLVANDVDDVVDRDSSDDAIVVVDDRRGQQIAILEFPDHLLRRRMPGNRHHVGCHHARHQRVRVVRQETRQEQ